MNLSIITPTYNRASRAQGALSSNCKKLITCAEQLDLQIEIIIVDDGSEDATMEEVSEMFSSTEQVSVLSRGKCRAC